MSTWEAYLSRTIGISSEAISLLYVLRRALKRNKAALLLPKSNEHARVTTSACAIDRPGEEYKVSRPDLIYSSPTHAPIPNKRQGLERLDGGVRRHLPEGEVEQFQERALPQAAVPKVCDGYTRKENLSDRPAVRRLLSLCSTT